MDALDGGARDGREAGDPGADAGRAWRRGGGCGQPCCRRAGRGGGGGFFFFSSPDMATAGNDAAPLQDVGATVRSLFAAGRPDHRDLRGGRSWSAPSAPRPGRQGGGTPGPGRGGGRFRGRCLCWAATAAPMPLAERIAGSLGGVAAVTTAGDRRLGVALDAPPRGWRLGRCGPVQAARRPRRLIAGGGGAPGRIAALAGDRRTEPGSDSAAVHSGHRPRDATGSGSAGLPPRVPRARHRLRTRLPLQRRSRRWSARRFRSTDLCGGLGRRRLLARPQGRMSPR